LAVTHWVSLSAWHELAEDPCFSGVLRKSHATAKDVIWEMRVEHNFGHGKQNLSVVFAMLMMLAFLVDQTQQLCCPLFRAIWQKFGSKRALWDNLRSHFRHIAFMSMQHLYEVMLCDLAKELPAPQPDTS
jgi:hypothetical protein